MSFLRVYYCLDQKKQNAEKTLPGDQPEPELQFGVGVSKRYFKKAVHRNRIKRLIREAYRVQKLLLQGIITERKDICLKLFIIFTGRELPTFDLVKGKVAEVLQRLEKQALKKS